MISTKTFKQERLFLHRLSQAKPGSGAIVDLADAASPVSISYGELDALSDRAAQGLIELGVEEGENVAYLLPNRWEFVVFTLAVWKIGAVACPLLPVLREREIPFIVGRAQS